MHNLSLSSCSLCSLVFSLFYSILFILVTVGTILTQSRLVRLAFYQYKLKLFPPTSQFSLIEVKRLLEGIVPSQLTEMV